MRSIVFLLLLLPVFTYSQKWVPEPVKQGFKEKFPEVKKTKWEKKGDNFEAEFKEGKTEVEALFTAAGNWMYTVREIDRRQLPVEVINGFRSEGFADWKLDEAGTADTPLYKDVYLIEAEKDKLNYDLFFDKSGKLLQKQLVKEGK